jgi:sialidase-1
MYLRTAIIASITLAASTWSSTASAQLWLDPRCKQLPLGDVVQLVELRDGRLLTLEGSAAKTSTDDGRTWSTPQKIYDGPAPGIPTRDYSIVFRTKANTLLVLYMDQSSQKFAWDSAKKETSADTTLPVWVIRSLDQGKTWIDRHKVLDGYCGALIGMIQTQKGQIVAPVHTMLDHNRHATLTIVSADDGKTWRKGNIIDLGGRGHHDGADEATVAGLSDGRLLMLLRTGLDRFWEAYSDDGGRYWRELRPSQIDASSAPGYLLRLASGRLALAWNRLYPEGKSTIARRDDSDFTEVPTSWQREELSLAFSQDDAKTWTKPVVVARQPGGGLSYPSIVERRPGELWIITRFPTKSSFSLKEADFASAKQTK